MTNLTRLAIGGVGAFALWQLFKPKKDAPLSPEVQKQMSKEVIRAIQQPLISTVRKLPSTAMIRPRTAPMTRPPVTSTSIFTRPTPTVAIGPFRRTAPSRVVSNFTR